MRQDFPGFAVEQKFGTLVCFLLPIFVFYKSRLDSLMPRINSPRINLPSTTPSISSNTESGSRESLLPSSTNAGSGPTGLLSGFFSRRRITLDESSSTLKRACETAKSGDLNKLQELLRENPSLFTETDKKGNSLLTLSAENAQSAQSLLFLARLLHPEAIAAIVNHRNYDGNTALALALKSGKLEAAEVLLREPSINLKLVNNSDQTALHLAASTTPEVMTLLLHRLTAQACLPELLNCRDRDGITALSAAVRSTKPEIVEILLQQPDIDVNLADNDQRTPLHIAATSAWTLDPGIQKKLLNLLLNYPSIQANLPDKSGDTPLHACIKYVPAIERALNILSLEEQAGSGWKLVPLLANSQKVDPNQRDADGKTPLELAMEGCRRVRFDYSPILNSIAPLLGNANIDPNRPGRDGRAPVWQAVDSFRIAFAISDSRDRERYIAPLMALANSSKVDFGNKHNGQTIIEHLQALQPPSDWTLDAKVDWKRKREDLMKRLLEHERFATPPR